MNWQIPAQLPDLRRVDLAAIDTETKDDRLRADMGSGWPFRAGYLCGVSIAYRANGEIRGHYLPIRHPDTENFPPEQVYQWVRDHIAAGVRFVTQNGLYDWGWLRAEADIHMPNGERLEEISALATLVDENRFKYSLGALCAWRGLPGKDNELLRQGIEALGLHSNKRKKLVPQTHIWQLPARYVGPYAEADAINTLALFDNLNPILDQEGTRAAYRLECDILPMVLEMRRRGIRIDLDAAEQARNLLLRKRDAALSELSEKLGCAVGMDEIHGRKWLVETFERLEIKYPCTEKGNPSFTAGKLGWMAGHAHWLPPLIATANKYNKVAADFLSKLIDHAVNGRVHAEINPHRSEDNGTKSFRFSYSDPPLQQMPSRDEEIAPLIRGVFLPEEGEIWAKPDASQQEFRFVVHYANQHRLRKAAEAVARYRDDPDTDFHALAATITQLERSGAKAVNFAKIYGAGVKKFAQMIGKPLQEAQRIYNQYDNQLPFLRLLSKIYSGQAHRQGYITLYDGARRHFDRFAPGGKWQKRAGPCPLEEAQARLNNPHHPWHGRGPLYRADARTALNALIQGSAARHTKLWMRACWREGITPLLQMHDALDCSVHSREQAEMVARLGEEAVKLDVPMRVDLKYGKTWGDAIHTWDKLCNGVENHDALFAGQVGSGASKITHHEPFVSVEPETGYSAAVENPDNFKTSDNSEDFKSSGNTGAKVEATNGAANGNAHNSDSNGNGYRHDDKDADKPYRPVRSALLAKGYHVTQTFPFAVPGATEPLFYEDRYELWSGLKPTKQRPRKTCRFWHRDNGHDLNGTGPRRIIYNWPAILQAGPGATVFITEGANKSKVLNDAGLLATAAPYHQWKSECASALAGNHLIYLADHNPDGGNDPAPKFAADARLKLTPHAASFRIMPAAQLWKYLPSGVREIRQGDDIKDWIALGGDLTKLRDLCLEIPADGVINAEPYNFPEEQNIAVWEWLYGRHLLRGEVAGTAAMGGTGKSSKSIVETLAMTSSQALLDEEVPERPLRVVLINLEDTRNTMEKRIAAVMRHYGLTKADIGDRLIVIAKGEIKIKIARQLRSGDVERNEQDIHALTQLMIKHNADVLSIDSFIRTHRVHENDNSAIQEVVECFENIATAAQCAVHLWHHTRKSGGDKVTIESTRGAGAFVDACRSARILETMSAKEHAELKAVQPEMLAAGYYFRSFNGKRNFAPPADQSDWFKLESITLRNGDAVGVVTPWQYPATWADLSPEISALVLAEIEKGLPNGQLYSNDNAAKKRAAYLVVQKHCPNKTRSQARAVIANWLKNGTLYEDKYDDRIVSKQQTGLFVR